MQYGAPGFIPRNALDSIRDGIARLVSEQTNGQRGPVLFFFLASSRLFVRSVRLTGVFVCFFACS